MSELKRSTTHVVIRFEGEIIEGAKKSVDLVPRTWLKFIERDNKWLCYFPHQKDWQYIDKWCESSKPPRKDWKASEVTIIKEAGMLRLKLFAVKKLRIRCLLVVFIMSYKDELRTKIVLYFIFGHLCHTYRQIISISNTSNL